MTNTTKAQRRANAKQNANRLRLAIAVNPNTEPELYKLCSEMKQRGNYSAEIKRLILESGNE